MQNQRKSLVATIPLQLATLIAIAFLMLINPAKAKAQSQVSKDLDARLEKISKKMYRKDESNFIIVDAIRDNFIKIGSPYNFEYTKDSSVKINGKELPQPFDSIYIAKLGNFYKHKTSWVRYSGDSIRLITILNPNSEFRKRDENSRKLGKSLAHKKKWRNHLYKQIAKDHLADTLKPMHIVYNSKGVFINEKKLSGKMGKKYNRIFIKEEGKVTDSTKAGAILYR